MRELRRSRAETTVPGMSTHRAFYDLVRQVPVGSVVTYGQVAVMAGFPGRARQVGYAMAAVPDDSDIPWYRVINVRGEVSARSGGSMFERLQRILLEEEGVTFDEGGRVDLERYRWEG